MAHWIVRLIGRGKIFRSPQTLQIHDLNVPRLGILSRNQIVESQKYPRSLLVSFAYPGISRWRMIFANVDFLNSENDVVYPQKILQVPAIPHPPPPSYSLSIWSARWQFPVQFGNEGNYRTYSVTDCTSWYAWGASPRGCQVLRRYLQVNLIILIKRY